MQAHAQFDPCSRVLHTHAEQAGPHGLTLADREIDQLFRLQAGGRLGASAPRPSISVARGDFRGCLALQPEKLVNFAIGKREAVWAGLLRMCVKDT